MDTDITTAARGSGKNSGALARPGRRDPGRHDCWRGSPSTTFTTDNATQFPGEYGALVGPCVAAARADPLRSGSRMKRGHLTIASLAAAAWMASGRDRATNADGGWSVFGRQYLALTWAWVHASSSGS